MGVNLLRSKIAVSFFFVSCGSALALWAVHIPLIQETVGIDYTTLGLLLMLSAIGGFGAMQLSGWMIDHVGARTSTRIGGVAVGLSLLGPALSTSPWMLGLAIMGLGLGLAGLDVAVNAAALQVEKVNKKAIFTFFHLFWSVGGLLGAGIGFVTISAGFVQSQTLTIYGALLSILGFFMANWLLPDEPVANSENKVANKAAGKSNRRVLGFVVLAGLMASSGAIIEGVAQDWSALYLKDVQNVSVALAAWGLAAFNIGMILGRIFIDRIVEQRGRGFVIRWGALFSAVAIGLQAIAPNFEVSLFFWFLLGLGVSGVVPQLIASSGEIGEASHSGRNMAKVAGITYVGGLAGPSIIGLLTQSLPLEVAIGWGSLLGIFIVLSYSQLQKLPK